MARGRRCDLGCESWPEDAKYKRCPECGQPTTVYGNLQPIDEEEASSRLLHAQFDIFYKQYCKVNGFSAEDDSTVPRDLREDAYYDGLYPGGRGDPKPA